jgi:hypothetical protein
MLHKLHLKKYSFKIIIFIFFLIVIGLFSTRNAFAANYNLSGKISNNLGDAINGATVSVNDSNLDTVTTDSSGNYSLLIPEGVYNIQVTPPSGDNYSPAIALSQTISSDTTLNFTLVPSGSVTLSGQIYGPLNNPLPNQRIILQSSSENASTNTDAQGNYSLQVSPGTYTILIIGDNNDKSLNAPQTYQLQTSYVLSQSTILNIRVPANKVILHVQDSSEIPIEGAGTSVPFLNYGNVGGLSIGGNITNATGESSYGANGPGPTTDSSGDVVLWLFPNNGNHSYQITAIAPSGSNFKNTTLSNVVLTGDTQKTITLLHLQLLIRQGTIRYKFPLEIIRLTYELCIVSYSLRRIFGCYCIFTARSLTRLSKFMAIIYVFSAF